MDFELVIGNKNWSSWSMRPWLVMVELGLTFREGWLPLRQPDTKARARELSPNAKVPLLCHGQLRVWESLAIAEYLAELHPERQLWPTELAARAVARAVSHEMHAGFVEVREELGMALGASLPCPELSDGAKAGLARFESIVHDCRGEFGAAGPFLFGDFGIADAMYAPFVTRLKTYGVPVNAETQAYCAAVLARPSVQRWYAEAADEVANGHPSLR